MTQVKRVFIIHLAIAAAALAIGLGLAGWYFPAGLIVAISVFWYLSMWRGAHGVETLFLLLFLLISSAGFFWFDLHILPALIATVAALGAWDLDHFLQRIRVADPKNQETVLGSNHLKRLLTAEGAGLAFGLAAAFIRVSLPFWVILLLIFAAVIGISRLVFYVRRQTG
jgi:hypothetical protein